MKSLIFALLLLSCASFAQTVKVLSLAPDETKEALDIQKQRAALDKREADLTERINKTHLQTTNPAEGAATLGYVNVTNQWERDIPVRVRWRTGWESGFLYSDDFKFIVPKPYSPPVSTSWPCSNLIGAACVTTNLSPWATAVVR